MSRILTMSRAGREALGRIDPLIEQSMADELMRKHDSSRAGV